MNCQTTYCATNEVKQINACIVFSRDNTGFKFAHDHPIEINEDTYKFWVTPVKNPAYLEPLQYHTIAQPSLTSYCKVPMRANHKYHGDAVNDHVFRTNNRDDFVNGHYLTRAQLAEQLAIGFVQYKFITRDSIVVPEDFTFIESVMYDGQNETKYVPREIALHLMDYYCRLPSDDEGSVLPNILDVSGVCHRLRHIESRVYNTILNDVCVGSNLETDVCKTYCSVNDVNCDARLISHCTDPDTDTLSDATADLCGCFMGNEFYRNYFNSLTDKFHFQVLTPPKNVCYFDYCASSTIKPYAEKQKQTKCPDIMTCFQNVDVKMDAGGKIIAGDIHVKQSEKCTSIKTKCKVTADCPIGSHLVCVEGICVSNTAVDVPLQPAVDVPLPQVTDQPVSIPDTVTEPSVDESWIDSVLTNIRDNAKVSDYAIGMVGIGLIFLAMVICFKAIIQCCCIRSKHRRLIAAHSRDNA